MSARAVTASSLTASPGGVATCTACSIPPDALRPRKTSSDRCCLRRSGRFWLHVTPGSSMQQHLKHDDDQAEGAVDQPVSSAAGHACPRRRPTSMPHPTSWTTPFHNARRTANPSLNRPSAPSSRNRIDRAGAASIASSWPMMREPPPVLFRLAQGEALGPGGSMAAKIAVERSELPATISVAQAAELLGVSRSAAYRAVAAGQLPALRLGRRIHIPTAPLLAMLGVSPEEHR